VKITINAISAVLCGNRLVAAVSSGAPTNTPSA
jgi:hypothetical protein